MKEVVDQFAHVVFQAHFDVERASNQKLVERCALTLIDGSRLAAYESRTGTKFKYSYQWMDKANQTIYRWDNTAHFPVFNIYPYHRHVGAAEIAERFQWYRFRKHSGLLPTSSLCRRNNLQSLSEDGNESLPVLPVPNLR